MGVTVIDGLHLGAGVSYYYDYISILKASRINDEEGAPDYSNDVILQGTATGSHVGWNAGFFFDKFKKAQIGASYTYSGTFNADSGEGQVTVPESITNPTVSGGLVVPATVAVELPLPPIVRAYVKSRINPDLVIGGGWELQLWHVCCGEEAGDIHTTLLSTDGDPIGEADGVAINISPDIYNPRRLWGASTFAFFGGYDVNKKAWAGWNLRYNQNAVPDYAVSATNLDFESVGAMLQGRYQVTEAMHIGLSYSKFFLFSREITDSAWNRGDGNARFSPAVPATTSGNGTYEGKADIFGIRVGVKM